MPPSPKNSLFKSGFTKRKTSDTTAEEIEASKVARQTAEQLALAQQFNDVPVAPVVQGKKKLSSNPDAVRKRNEYQKKKKQKAKAKPQRDKAVIDAAKRAEKAEQVDEAERETHYEDARGRERKRKRARSRADASAVLGPSGNRVYTDTEKQLIVDCVKAQQSRVIGNINFATVAKNLQDNHPSLFGAHAPGRAISRQAVRTVYVRHQAGEIDDGRGRPPALPQSVVVMILAAFTSVITARTTIVSAPMLQPIAIGVILAAGYGSLLNAGRAKRGQFCCSLNYIRGIMKDNGWRNVKPQGDTRKLPSNWAALRAAMVLRLAYFVFAHNIPKALVINADHTGIMFTQVKGSMWITKDMAAAKDKSVKGHGDKRQFTLLATTAATGEMLPHQVVVEGKTVQSLPKFGVKYAKSVDGKNTKGNPTVCFSCPTPDPTVSNIASFCCTSNHWSDNITSRAYVKDVAVPYFRRQIDALRAADPSACKPFGTQVCVLIVDCWWGWLDAELKQWMRTKYPWLRLLFVPAACTPVAQPMDAGIIAKIKGKLRTLYGKWVVGLTQEQIKQGVSHEKINIPADVPTCKKNLFQWLSLTVSLLNNDKNSVAHCWAQTDLLCAWEREKQIEATRQVKDLFPNVADITIDVTDEGGEEDVEAGALGVPFTQNEDDEEWVGWVDWEGIPETGGAGR